MNLNKRSYWNYFSDTRKGKYDAGMSFVALAISDDDWEKLCAGDLDDEKSRNLVTRVQKDTMTTACEMEKQFKKNGKAKERSQPTIHSLGVGSKTVRKTGRSLLKHLI